MEPKAIAYQKLYLAQKTEGAEMVASLPYVDNELTNPQLKQQMQELIKSEMRVMRVANKTRKNYLEGLPLPSLPLINSEQIAKEIERVRASGIAQIDLRRYESRIDPPERQDDLLQWDSAIDRAKVNMEYSVAQLQNAELLEQFGPAKYRGYVQQLEEALCKYEEFDGTMANGIETINRERKAMQVKLQEEKLRPLEEKIHAGVQKNVLLCQEIQRMQNEMEELEKLQQKQMQP